MGGSTLPTASTPGYGTFHGKVGCDCVIEFLTVAERLGILMGLIEESLDVVQLTGDADASNGVHSLGSAFDLKQRSDPWVRLFRNMGASYWPREGAAWVGNEHGHGSIPCPHDDRVAYQHLAYRRGYNGLGRGWYGGQYLLGYGAKDPCWRPSIIRTRTQGLAWAKAEITRIEDIVTPEDKKAIIDGVTTALLSRMPSAVWGADIIDAPKPTAENPNWAPSSFLTWQFRQGEATQDVVVELSRQLAETKTVIEGLRTQLDEVEAKVDELGKA
jgi:hypothetical protein